MKEEERMRKPQALAQVEEEPQEENGHWGWIGCIYAALAFGNMEVKRLTVSRSE